MNTQLLSFGIGSLVGAAVVLFFGAPTAPPSVPDTSGPQGIESTSTRDHEVATVLRDVKAELGVS